MRISIDVDNRDVLAAMDQLGDECAVFVNRACQVTANRVALGMRARVRVRTGETQRGIVAEEARDGNGWVVIAGNERMPNLPRWIDTGTRFMDAKPFREPAVELERAAHHDRLVGAVFDAIRAKGLGDK